MEGGVINFLKVPGPTSQAVVARLKRLFGLRAGHLGTLDPAAAGVLVILLGGATRLAQFLPSEPKAYRFEAVFGESTSTGDVEGEIIAEASAAFLTLEDLEAAASRLTGRIRQVPPPASAVKVGGRPLYRYFREGRAVEAPAREVTVHALKVVDFRPGQRARALIEAVVSGGTYVRSLVVDLGRLLDLPAHVSFLLRRAVGPFALERSLAFEEVAADPAAAIISPEEALRGLPAREVPEDVLLALRHGRESHLGGPDGAFRLLDNRGYLVGVGRIANGALAARIWVS